MTATLPVDDVDVGVGELWDSIDEIVSREVTVRKYIFTSESAVAESVLYRYPTYQERTVICCSTMSGCPVGCRFCGAGDYYVRALTADEIVSQPVHLLETTGVDPGSIDRLQIMFMSMGEPLLNLRHLTGALRRLYADYPRASLLISTSGPDVNYAPFIELSTQIPTIGLQFSVHESTDEARDALIPFARKLDLAGIARQGVAWASATGRRPFFNYCVHAGNNSPADVSRLVALFDPDVWEATISVICERDESIAAANDRQRQLAGDFVGLMLSAGYSTRMFDPAGQDDIAGGCGQLHQTQAWMRANPERTHRSAGYGLRVVHTPTPITLSLPTRSNSEH
jgi:23S rRNA (adenine2503-C2)-methyltransferase